MVHTHGCAGAIEFRVQFPWFGYSGYKLVVIAAAGMFVDGTWFVLMRTRIGWYAWTQFDRERRQAFGIPVRGGVYSMISRLVDACQQAPEC